MTDAFMVELPTGAAGVAVRVRGGFRFYASRREFRRAQQHTYRDLRALHASLMTMVDAERRRSNGSAGTTAPGRG